MLMRLVEELALETRARVVVLDSNSDFVRLDTINDGVWSNDKLKIWLPNGDTRAAFEAAWKRIRGHDLVILSNRNLPGSKAIAVDCGNLSLPELAALLKIDLGDSSELDSCLRLTRLIAEDRWDPSEEPFYDFDHFRDVAQMISTYLEGGDIEGGGIHSDITQNPRLAVLRREFGAALGVAFRERVDKAADFGIWRSKGDGGKDFREIIAQGTRLVVVDLLSIEDEQERLVAANMVLGSLWNIGKDSYSYAAIDLERPDSRVVTFVVIDEAHNLVPATPNSSNQAELVSTAVRLATEGRKFGLRLVVATQRPRRLDVNVLSQCDNLFLMRTSNVSDLSYVRDTLGLVDVPDIETARRLKSGDIVFSGEISNQGGPAHCCPPRTVPGARGIPTTNWDSPVP